MPVDHPIEIYEAAKAQGVPHYEARRKTHDFLVQSLEQDGVLPWKEWFETQTNAMEILCRDGFLAAPHSVEGNLFWKSLPYWRDPLFEDHLVRSKVFEYGHDVSETVWFGMVSHRGVQGTLDWIAMMSKAQNRPFLETACYTKSSLLVLVLQLGILENESLMREHGLQGQSMHFWACATARSCGQHGWRLFDALYPQHTISLVQQLMVSEKCRAKEGVSDFISEWFTHNRSEALALLTYWEEATPMMEAVSITNVPQEMVEQGRHQRLIMDGLGASYKDIKEFLVQYRSLFASTTPNIEESIELPALQFD